MMRALCMRRMPSHISSGCSGMLWRACSPCPSKALQVCMQGTFQRSHTGPVSLCIHSCQEAHCRGDRCMGSMGKAGRCVQPHLKQCATPGLAREGQVAPQRLVEPAKRYHRRCGQHRVLAGPAGHVREQQKLHRCAVVEQLEAALQKERLVLCSGSTSKSHTAGCGQSHTTATS
jgi:hypothetical protein